MCGALARRGVTANQVTLAAAALSVAAGVWIAWSPTSPWPLIALPLVLFLRMALNAIDGMLAREFDQKSRLGALLNEMGDVVSDAVLYLPLAMNPQIPSWAIVALVVLAVMVEMIGVVAVQIGADRRYDGPFGKSDRACAFGLLGFLLGVGVPGGAWVAIYLGVGVLLSLFTLYNRARRALVRAGETV